MGGRGVLGLLALLMTAACGTAVAADADWEACRGPVPEAAIRGCGNVLDRGGRENPQSRANAYGYRGNARDATRDFQGAIDDYGQWIALDPANPTAYINRGNTRGRMGADRESLQDYDRSLALAPAGVDAFLARGTAKARLGDQEGAIADYGRAIDLDGRRAPIWFERAKAETRQARYREAVLDFDRAIELGLDSAALHIERGVALSWLKSDREAAAEYSKAIALDAKNALAWYERGKARARMADDAAALPDYDQAIALESKQAAYFLERGRSRGRTGDASRALDDFSAALALEPGNAEALASAGEVQAKLAAIGSKPSSKAEQSSRIALVIGNSAYREVSPLANPRSDAEAMGRTLALEGFSSVTTLVDASRADMIRALRSFGEEADKADWAMVYYAGHGMELNGSNYLIPVDAKLASERDLEFEAVPLRQVQDLIAHAAKLKIVVLDACRNNPFDARMKRAGGTRSVARGLAPSEPEDNTLILYAAKGGETAEDGTGGHSPLAAALLARLPERGLEVNKLFRLVIDDVQAATARKQRPFVYGSVTAREDFYFAGQ